MTIIIIAGILVWACKNPHGARIDFSGLVDYIPLTQRADGPGYTNYITYRNNTIIDPTTYMWADKKLYENVEGIEYRILAILTFTNRDILAFADKIYGGAGDLPNKIEVYVKSTNNGTNWEQEKNNNSS